MEEPGQKANRGRRRWTTLLWIVVALLAAFVILFALGSGRSTLDIAMGDCEGAAPASDVRLFASTADCALKRG